MGDDDRIKFNSIKELNIILRDNPNISGITLNHDFIKNIQSKIYKNKEIKKKLENFNITTHIYKLGMLSAQIINTKKFNQIKKLKKNYFNNAYFHLGIIINLIVSEKNWKYLDKKMIVYRYGVINRTTKLSYLKRLDDEFKGYLKPVNKLTKENYVVIFKNIFYNNIISWILLNIKLNGKIKTFKIIFKNLQYIPLDFLITLILITMFILPVALLNHFKQYKS